MERKLSELSHEELLKYAEENAAALVAKDNQITDLRKQVDAKDKELVATKTELKGTVLLNTKLSKELENIPAPAKVEETKTNGISSETFEVDGKTYGFKKRVVYLGNDLVTAAEVLASEDLQKHLVEKQSGLIYEKASQ